MLIEMETLSNMDREVWASYKRYDKALAAGSQLAALEKKAINYIQAFKRKQPGAICSTSWGKDSVVITDLVQKADPTIPIVWIPALRSDGYTYEAEASFKVRDAFLQKHPNAIYEERPVTIKHPHRDEPGWEEYINNPVKQDILSEAVKEPYISGLRGSESKSRRASINYLGVNTKYTSRPLAFWQAPYIFAYIEKYDLPLHPAYAASFGGQLKREWLRVHLLRSPGENQNMLYAREMTSWEDHYFPELIKYSKYFSN